TRAASSLVKTGACETSWNRAPRSRSQRSRRSVTVVGPGVVSSEGLMEKRVGTLQYHPRGRAAIHAMPRLTPGRGGRYNPGHDERSSISTSGDSDPPKGAHIVPRMTGKRALMEQLVADGVRHVFGNPGTTEQGFLDILQEYPQIEFILALHEGVAISMA